MSTAMSAQHGGMTEEEYNRLRQHIAENVIGDNPPTGDGQAAEVLAARVTRIEAIRRVAAQRPPLTPAQWTRLRPILAGTIHQPEAVQSRTQDEQNSRVA